MNERADVLVVGAGPAGYAAAIVLARNGIDTLLCDSRETPIDKACGEGVMPTGWAHLENLGVAGEISPHASFPIAGVRYVGPSGRSAETTFAEGPGRGVRREVLSHAFHATATRLSSLRIVTSERAKLVHRSPDGVVARVGDRTIVARLVVGADGLHSHVRKWAGLHAGTPTRQRWGVRQHFHIRPWTRSVEVSWRAGVEAYVTPVADDLVGVALLWDRAHPQEPSAIDDALYPSLLRRFPELEARLAHVEAASTIRGAGPMAQHVRTPIADGIALIGDAAGYHDAISGEGLSLATAQALALERTVVPVLLREPRSTIIAASKLHDYARAATRIRDANRWLIQCGLLVGRHPMLIDALVAALAKNPRAFQRLLTANMGGASQYGALALLFPRLITNLVLD